MQYKTVEEYDMKIKELKEQAKNAKGKKTMVYSRIVGHYQPIQYWNPGKKEEFKDRLTFRWPE